LWLHTAPLVALSQIAFYGWLSAEVQVVMVAAALAYRRSWVPAAARAPHEAVRDEAATRPNSVPAVAMLPQGDDDLVPSP
jgi:hypothetical protein